ncbi:ABC transporter permease [Robinsoniella peoriensis]|uniref:ABC-2 family transporter protein n=1 Tax=Robinsoniella peoriensis TaxID=180332 RepID=A0A4U8QFZ4_9FIRM|nr:ABC transporter permease [Robinsoniella peoriensis]MDU7026314.1 ABC transporter permease [Clostridiales bacterium]TLD00636.1 ABC-2 family transporter protein [Robinsoniella peoriensis]
MIQILKNDLDRVLCNKKNAIMTLVLTICMVGFAIYFTNKIQVIGNLAVVGNVREEIGLEHYFNISYVLQEPKESELVSGRYDAVIKQTAEGYGIQTLKGDTFKNMVMQALKDPAGFVPETDRIRGVGTNIIGYLVMILLMQGVLHMEYYGEDKEKHLVERIAVSPISFVKYLAAHFLYAFLMLFLPSMGVVAAARIIGLNIGLSLWEYAALLGILCMLSVSFGIFMHTFCKSMDSANMTASPLIVLTSVLGGTFYSYAHSSQIMNGLINVLPQKNFISFVNGVEKGSLNIHHYQQLGYCLVIILVLTGISIVRNCRKYRPAVK